ncbi:hypothetical protein KAX97_07885 [candidate division WOR-3 bacterium]|nr:hypothetical protein [candidate division WOR-3 bacterium]
MKIKRINRKDYLLVEITNRDKKYLEGMNKYEHAQTVKNTDEYLSNVLAVHIKSVYVMSAATNLETEGVITKKKADKVFDDMDNAMEKLAQVIDNYFIELSDLLDSISEKKK